MTLMRFLPLLLLLGACGAVDTSPGASGVPDMPFGQPGWERGSQSTSGAITLNRELAPGDPRRFNLPPGTNTAGPSFGPSLGRAFQPAPAGDPRRLGW